MCDQSAIEKSESGSDDPAIDTESCTSCGKCEQVCEDDAIIVESTPAAIDQESCMLCKKCVDICQYDAITYENDQ